MEFTKVEKAIKEKEKRIKMFELDPEQYVKYTSANPMDEYVVEAYNNAVNGKLKDLRAESNVIRKNQALTQKDKTELLKVLTLEQNIIKRNMIDTFKALEVDY